jgi:putative oxidoreductase
LPEAQQYGDQISFFKDLALAGGLLVVAGFGAGAASIDGRRRP